MEIYNAIKVTLSVPVEDDRIYRTYSFEHKRELTNESTALGVILEFAELMNSEFGTYNTLNAVKECYNSLNLKQWDESKVSKTHLF